VEDPIADAVMEETLTKGKTIKLGYSLKTGMTTKIV